MRGSQNITGKVEKISDLDVLAQVRLQAKKVNKKSVLYAALFTLAGMLIPSLVS